ncbi:hypothetical protein P154DRAFT_581975 [Amniculicola lignicola CBS 123094]|uniref:Uncharacterized protein n=1 Tax=Amniculicola lignicola CBS 123094 TaxID=1392246 RepID=A0A6A5W027_9PLEO|nr:hypothetical protein P154DRAFT_581975 [Amniculicola lignicola CBS 123094]
MCKFTHVTYVCGHVDLLTSSISTVLCPMALRFGLRPDWDSAPATCFPVPEDVNNPEMIGRWQTVSVQCTACILATGQRSASFAAFSWTPGDDGAGGVAIREKDIPPPIALPPSAARLNATVQNWMADHPMADFMTNEEPPEAHQMEWAGKDSPVGADMSIFTLPPLEERLTRMPLSTLSCTATETPDLAPSTLPTSFQTSQLAGDLAERDDEDASSDEPPRILTVRNGLPSLTGSSLASASSSSFCFSVSSSSASDGERKLTESFDEEALVRGSRVREPLRILRVRNVYVPLASSSSESGDGGEGEDDEDEDEDGERKLDEWMDEEEVARAMLSADEVDEDEDDGGG